jgi:hypothetical protein
MSAKKFVTRHRGTSLNALTFKNRAERLGRKRGSVCDCRLIRVEYTRHGGP